ncbi:MgtC/SapB family protein [Luteolibacter flavescens]|uniref:MgtC/SapB family protein n=1 Tax=Luteolibacter flavescens TaxID=1859460 RepID=A0ABT3FJX7_9BACT|nr:MgtC/SapB family protein [Luteolibacter flavescens]MCW1883846.1 MgtC/SapB family protein [Luteolibacter flavescens]
MPDPETIPGTLELLKSLGTALGLGLLVGLQREWTRDRIAGIRTFALVSLFGALSGLISLTFGGWVFAASLLACVAVLIVGNVTAMREGKADAGLTTEIAVLVMFVTGAATMTGYLVEAVVCAGTVMVLLQSKAPLHGMVRKIGEDDLREIARLVLAGLVILPLLPNKEMGYLGVLNPFKIWLMVVLIIGMSLAAYLIGKFMSGAKGAAVAGILGGLISSTATTASVSRRSRDAGAGSVMMAAIIMTASSVVFVRVIAEVVVVAPSQYKALLPPLLAMMGWTAIVAVVTHRLASKEGAPPKEESAPSELKGAIVFGLLYVLVLYGVALAKQHFGNAGLYVVAAVSGLTDMDAITLSTAGMVNSGHVDPKTGWRVILLGGLANLIFKAGMAVSLGGKGFRVPVISGFAASFAGGLAIFFLWP